MRRRIWTSLPAAAMLCMAVAVTPGLAQERSVVSFEKGNFGTMVSGTVVGNGYVDYVLGAQEGQDMFVELTVRDSNGNGTVYFNILPPGSTGEAIYIGSTNGNSVTQPLPASGDFVIRVYQMGNDADTGKTTGFDIDISIQ